MGNIFACQGLDSSQRECLDRHRHSGYPVGQKDPCFASLELSSGCLSSVFFGLSEGKRSSLFSPTSFFLSKNV